jgi:hypothetical protein
MIAWERTMRCGACGQQNRGGAKFCDGCGARLAPDVPAREATVARQCISCGKGIDLAVYFTICPHCGFNYRIEITPVRPDLASSRRSQAFLYVVSILVPMAGFMAGAMLWKDADSRARRLANECVGLGVLNIIISPILILKYFGLA